MPEARHPHALPDSTTVTYTPGAGKAPPGSRPSVHVLPAAAGPPPE